jgi:hypothetical protein
MARPNPATPRRTDLAAPAEPASYFTHLKLWITGLIGVLVVLPSLINAGLDVYSSLLKLPKTEAERINEKLFREYFGKQPVATVPVPIKQNNGIVEVRFQIYDKGDVFVEFGSFSQWFPFPAAEGEMKKPVAFSLMSSAHAQAPASSPVLRQGVGQYQQTDRMQRGALVREKIYQNGVVENQVIDTRSGDILDSSVRQSTQPLPAPPASGAVLAVPRVAPIDLDQYRKIQQIKATGAAPATNPPAVWEEGLKAELAWCAQKDWALSRYICAYQTTHKWCDQGNGWGTVKECKK